MGALHHCSTPQSYFSVRLLSEHYGDDAEQHQQCQNKRNDGYDASCPLRVHHKLCALLWGLVLRQDSSLVAGCQILAYHQGNLKDDGMIELTQIETGELLDLLQTINQRIAVNKQLA